MDGKKYLPLFPWGINMRTSRYVGVTGFTSYEEVEVALRAFDVYRDFHLRPLLMIGVLLSSKTLAGKKTRYPHRYPVIEDIPNILAPVRAKSAVRLIHYTTDDPDTVDQQIEKIMKGCGREIDGFQFNMAWPKPELLSKIPMHMRVVLQIGSHALKVAGNDPEEVARRVASYRGPVTDVLIDASGGRGVPIDLTTTDAYVKALERHSEWLRIGVAGGLNHAALAHDDFRQFMKKHSGKFCPHISIDAEGKLRTEDDRLDLHRMLAYLHAAFLLYSRT